MQAKLDLKQLAEQQKVLTEQLNANTEVAHKFKLLQEKPSIVQEAFDSLEIMLAGIKNELVSINKTSGLVVAESVVDITNHVHSVLETVLQSTNDIIVKSFKAVTTELSTDLKNINDDISRLNQLSLDIATSFTVHTNPTLGFDVLDELKLWVANLITSHTTKEPDILSDDLSDAHPSLETELTCKEPAPKKPLQKEPDPGWRVLGSSRIWKTEADWSEYDARQLRRRTQQKAAEKAKIKKKRNMQKNRRNHHFVNDVRSYSNQQNNALFNRANIDRRSKHNDNHGRCGGTSFLPPDRVLLAAAKERFSKPPSWPTHESSSAYRPIQFQRGETLNPDPHDAVPHRCSYDRRTNLQSPGCSSFSAAPCEACLAPHSCFRRH